MPDFTTLSTAIKFYKRKDIISQLINAAEDKEIAVKYAAGHFGKRPDIIKYEQDVLEFVKKGTTSFHCSEELWHNPTHIVTGMPPQELDELRKGWDLILDVDCPHLHYSRIAADLIIQALKHHNIHAISVKFSGNHGFHIGIPFEAFPEKVHNTPTKNLFPDGPRKIALYLQHMIKPFLTEQLRTTAPLHIIAKNVNKKPEELTPNGEFDPFTVLTIDTVLIASRHLYRMPYSLNEKSGLVSIPIPPEHILAFNTNDAKPDNVTISPHIFLDRTHAQPGEARTLILQAFDNAPNLDQETIKKTQEIELPSQALPEELFPPCVKFILKGLKDGRKRALFILINFLTGVGWQHDEIQQRLTEWNKNNQEPLREVLIKGQLSYHKRHNKIVPPPNCKNISYYPDLHACQPDNFCKKITNPLNYTLLKHKIYKSPQNPKNKSDA